MSVTVALPAAYAFSRYNFVGDKHLFFWLLTNRMTPPAVFLLPFFQLYSTMGLMDTHMAVALAHMVFNVPLAVWILEGFMSGVPRRSTRRPTSTATASRASSSDLLAADQVRRGRDGVLLLHVQLGGTAAGAHLTSVNAKPIAATMTRTVSAGMDWGVLAAAGVLTIVPAHGDLVRAALHRQGLRHGEGVTWKTDWMFG
jgi:glycerol transport system permease protein